MASINQSRGDRLTIAIRELPSTVDFPDLARVFEAFPGVTQQKPGSYFGHGCMISVGDSRLIRQEAMGIELANIHGIGCAPQIVEECHYDRGFGVLIKTIPGLRDEAPRRYEEASDKLAPDAIALLTKDMQTLADKGLIHQYAVEGHAHWFIEPVNGQILLDAWNTLVEAEPSAVDEAMDAFSRLV